MTQYRIPASLRRKPAIDQILAYYQYSKSVEEDYINLLQVEEAFHTNYLEEYKKFKKRYQGGEIRYSKTTPLYGVILERSSSSVYKESLEEYSYLCSLREEYYRVCQQVTRQAGKVTNTYSTTVPSNPNVKGTKVSQLSATVNVNRQQSVDTILHPDTKELEQQNSQLRQLVQKQGEDIKALQAKDKENSATIDDLRSRLSGLASKQLTEGNPNFTDLSDKNRPTKLAERFHAMYDEEWTNALEALSSKKVGGQTEDEAIFLLMTIVKEGYGFCKEVANEQIHNATTNLVQPCATVMKRKELSKDEEKDFKDTETKVIKLRRSCCFLPVKNITEKFKETSEEFKRNQKYVEVVKYTNKCMEILWLMRTMPDPPMALVWPNQGQKLDTDLYNHYQKKGTQVSITVWPAVLLHEDGPVIHKGFVKPL